MHYARPVSTHPCTNPATLNYKFFTSASHQLQNFFPNAGSLVFAHGTKYSPPIFAVSGDVAGHNGVRAPCAASKCVSRSGQR